MAAMASSSGDSVTRRSVASQFFTQEEGPGIDGMTTSERVSVVRRAGSGEVAET
jgi:symplekin